MISNGNKHACFVLVFDSLAAIPAGDFHNYANMLKILGYCVRSSNKLLPVSLELLKFVVCSRKQSVQVIISTAIFAK